MIASAEVYKFVEICIEVFVPKFVYPYSFSNKEVTHWKARLGHKLALKNVEHFHIIFMRNVLL